MKRNAGLFLSLCAVALSVSCGGPAKVQTTAAPEGLCAAVVECSKPWDSGDAFVTCAVPCDTLEGPDYFPVLEGSLAECPTKECNHPVSSRFASQVEE